MHQNVYIIPSHVWGIYDKDWSYGVINGALIYKYVYQFIENETWTIYLSVASIAMFGVVTISLTVIFSLVFAVQTTEVEIVQYLKSE